MATMSEQDVFQVEGHNLVFQTLALLFTHLLKPETIENLRVDVIILCTPILVSWYKGANELN